MRITPGLFEGDGPGAAGLLADRDRDADGELEGLGEAEGVAEKVPLFAVSPKFTMITPPLPKRTCARSIHGTRSHNRHRRM